MRLHHHILLNIMGLLEGGTGHYLMGVESETTYFLMDQSSYKAWLMA